MKFLFEPAKRHKNDSTNATVHISAGSTASIRIFTTTTSVLRKCVRSVISC